MGSRERATPMAPDERRRAIVEAVVPLLRVHGHAVTTKQVAEAAGIAEGTIFRVFPDKRALLMATAQEIVDPADGETRMAEDLAGIPDLRGKITGTVKHLVERIDEAVVVMMALRPLLIESARAEGPAHAEHPPGPPAFITESNRRLLDNLARLLFEPHADELRVPPEQAALVLRSLVFGSAHPGARGEPRLSAEEIADVCLHGVARPEEVAR